ncbi:CAMK family protein kinase [Histomonas meleagridis]|uniref:CAMK family protein kinase n=1 Tax=Histomonas meleagridis TaxID=135588 RepID=UPI00355AC9F7|nr:CAMK family protein kinase [Histomonas meleagridis]KAH0800208.1 CAMK family protein kinase [Histomonas meleagridis]
MEEEEKKFSSNDFEVKSLIGEGSYGKIQLCEEKATDQLIVIKEISLLNRTAKEIEETQKETKILSLLHHPNIVAYKGSFIEDNKLYIMMEYVDGGDLGQKIKNATAPFEESQILNWFVQICLAIKHIHDRKIIHRDLKAENVFLMKNGMVKLGDFGVSKILDNTSQFAKTAIGTPYYISPELCQGMEYNAKSDIWALGCILYELCTLKHPFDSNCLNGLIIKIVRNKPAPISNQYSPKLRNLVDQLLQKQSRKRPNINQILSIDFVNEKVKNLLSVTMQKIEFSHSVFHGYKGGETPREYDIPNKSKAQLNPTKKPKTNITKPKDTIQSSRNAKRFHSQQSSSTDQNYPRKPLTVEEKRRIEMEKDQVNKAKQKAVLEKQKQKEAERKKHFEDLKREEKERKKKYEQLESPFRKAMNTKRAQNVVDGQPQQQTKPKTPKSKSITQQRDKEVEDLRKLIRRKRNEAKKQTVDNNHIQIGSVIFPIDNDDEFVSLAAYAQNIVEHPPENVETEDENENVERVKFMFKGKELQIPSNNDVNYENEFVRMFIEKGIGFEKLSDVYKIVAEKSCEMNEEQMKEEIEKILVNEHERDYYPLIQQLVLSDNISEN